jgi:TRAP-type mannitol/chloroaromatic compound transport system substrate-binding protein
LKELGASQVSIHSSEVYQAMQKGVIDAAESCTPFLDWGLGYGEITTFSSHPGWHQPGSMCGLIINQQAWKALPKHLQAVIKVAAQATVPWAISYHEYTSIEGTKLFAGKGVQEHSLNKEDLTKLAELANKYTYQMCAENPLFAKVAYSYFSYMHDMKKWRGLASPLMHGWADQPLPDLEKIKSYVK